jgi:hypothetical protein
MSTPVGVWWAFAKKAHVNGTKEDTVFATLAQKSATLESKE